ncbi:MAG: hypothetical protein GX594_11715 [Pirellulaceae bacterium]|nr:hypothetical protein [Pirellulaceae bacterium]
MKLYAQHGWGQGDKTQSGIRNGYIDGVIYSPRDIGLPRLQSHVAEVAEINPETDQFFDPQYYAAYNVTDLESRLGYLASCGDYQAFFSQRRRRELEQTPKTITKDIENCLNFQNELDITGLISPNILISRSFDSIEAAIAKNFIRQAGKVRNRLSGKKKPLYITLAVSREALLDRRELFSFLEDITILDEPPVGFYVLIAASSGDARADIFHADVIAGWLLINHSLSVNGYQVINGYSDLLTPFLGIAGATAGATGWWLNSRTFSLDRFLPTGGGRLPIPRYLSKILINRITHIELRQILDLRILPDILNKLKTDGLYPSNEGYLPQRTDEVLQNWEAIKSLCDDLCRDDLMETLELCQTAVKRAIEAYDTIMSRIRLDSKSNGDHLEAIKEGLSLFVRQAEIGETG